MTIEQAKNYIRRNPQIYLVQAAKTGYICPICGSGGGKNGTGVTTKDKIHYTCWRGCSTNADIIDIIGIERGIGTGNDSFIQRLNTAAEIYNIEIDTNTDGQKGVDKAIQSINQQTIPEQAKTAIKANTADYTEYYKQCRTDLLNSPKAISYLKGRGISIQIAAAYGLGYDAVSDPAEAGHPTPRIIIPTSKAHYVGRAIDPSTPKEYEKLNNKGGKPDIFNRREVLKGEQDTIFVVEGAFDALSIIEAGAAAIALNSTSNVKILLQELEKQRTDKTFIICLDKDKAGEIGTDELKKGLDRLNISYVTADICKQYKDPNEHLQSNKDEFIRAIQTAKKKTAAKPDNVSSYIDEIMSEEILKFRESSDRKTGFTNLDGASKGLYTGLYVIAAISSLGKTTFAHQMADNLATAGEEVLFFSMEQSRLELVSKSISRQTAKNDLFTAVNSLSIRQGYLPSNVLKAASDYKSAVSDRISIIEGNFNCTMSFIGDYVRRFINKTGKKPIVFIDYLQILQGEKDSKGKMQTTKETVDSTVTELKRLSREQDLTIFVISSVNRSNYLTPIDFESLKESGGIEYTADVIWGLQLQCLNADPVFDRQNNIKEKRETIRRAKAADPRKIELVCLKNRYGISSYNCYFNYNPKFDLFDVDEEQENKNSKDNTKRENQTNRR